MSIERRLRRLEGGADKACLQCGNGPGVPIRTHVLTYDDPEWSPDPETVYCGMCGFPLRFTFIIGEKKPRRRQKRTSRAGNER